MQAISWAPAQPVRTLINRLPPLSLCSRLSWNCSRMMHAFTSTISTYFVISLFHSLYFVTMADFIHHSSFTPSVTQSSNCDLGSMISAAKCRSPRWFGLVLSCRYYSDLSGSNRRHIPYPTKNNTTTIHPRMTTPSLASGASGIHIRSGDLKLQQGWVLL